ncbi:Nodulation receptor kinase-like protein [Rhynchospora pubera]|uniref:non-specific serine/threonine protein kinase n=1 Tax=Rhynchospora pubera TaxID=906938 RepID=A0AAV8FK63_9POAL|nr:Nodulation receptor kinase-like protein [Rhynchospora pubera]
MAVPILGLLIWLQFSLISVSASATGISKVCGTVEIVYLKDLDGNQFLINKNRIENSTLVCEKLKFYFEDGCFLRDPELSVWRKVVTNYCARDSDIFVHEERIANSVYVQGQKARKLLSGLQERSNNECTNKNNDLVGNKQSGDASSETDDLPLALPGFLLLSVGFLFPCFRPKRKEFSPPSVRPNQLINSVDSLSSIDVSSSSEKFPPATPHRVPPSPSRFAMSPQLNRAGSVQLTINQIIKATHNFSDSFKLGEGGFGTVYRTVLPDGRTVAVKRAKKEHFQGPRDEFSNEVELLAKIDHRNLVRLLGYIDKGNERILITEFVSNGTLREHLDGQLGKILDFNQRLEIAIDVAHALTYLHLYAEKTIIHRDVKSSNILLTESYRAKVSDFGFAKSGPSDTEKTHISTKVKGTAGYLDPEYLRTYQLTPKSDVFSFGILLVEILSGRRPVELKRNPNERITIRWAFKKFNEGNLSEILDPLLEERIDNELVSRLLNVAFQCAAPTRDDRPTMKEVAEQLWEIRKAYSKNLRRISG